MRRRPRSILPVVLLIGALALVLGIWLGGHPSSLPGPVRAALVQDSDGRLYDEAIDTLDRGCYRPVAPQDLINQSLDQAVHSLNDRFSNYFAPHDFSDFQQATNG